MVVPGALQQYLCQVGRNNLLALRRVLLARLQTCRHLVLHDRQVKNLQDFFLLFIAQQGALPGEHSRILLACCFTRAKYQTLAIKGLNELPEVQPVSI